jgi:hypothetical protein
MPDTGIAADVRDRLLDLVGDLGAELLTLEVNTIVRPGMSAMKMPDLPSALFTIANTYASFLKKFSLTDPILVPEWFATPSEDQARQIQDTFTRLKDRAGDLLVARETFVDDEDDPILFRIRGNARQILTLFGKDGDGKDAVNLTKPNADDRMLVRKIWDLGTEVVLMQTTLQIDGDVITRISPRLTRNEEDDGTGMDPAFVSAVHTSSLQLATQQWRALFDLAKDLLGVLGKAVFGIAG